MQPPHQDPTGWMESARASALRVRAKITSQLARALRFLSSRRFPWLALASSLIVHAVALMLVIKASFQERTIEPSDRIITMHLAPRSPREPEPDLEPDPEIEMPVTDPQPPVRQQQPAGANTATMDAPRCAARCTGNRNGQKRGSDRAGAGPGTLARPHSGTGRHAAGLARRQKRVNALAGHGRGRTRTAGCAGLDFGPCRPGSSRRRHLEGQRRQHARPVRDG